MMTFLSVSSMTMMKNLNPMKIAISILLMSILVMVPVYKTVTTSWITFVTILTFSSGMMTLFLYTASMTSNETSKTKKKSTIFSVVLIFALISPQPNGNTMKTSMKTFSNSATMIIMASMLILSMLAISMHGHHPNQTVSSSF